MSKRVTKILIGINNGYEETPAIIVYLEEEPEKYINLPSWTEVPIFLEERFYSKEGKTYYVPEDK